MNTITPIPVSAQLKTLQERHDLVKAETEFRWNELKAVEAVAAPYVKAVEDARDKWCQAHAMREGLAIVLKGWTE